ncbi:MAG: ABC transporter permease [Treponema sp.]|jgi:ribose transport system permease protein|nr:ABC transporter permease [Treponema sp.]
MTTKATLEKLRLLRGNYQTEMGVGLSLLILFVALSFASPYFLTGRNIINVLYQISSIGILAVGMTFIIITGGIDLSIGSIFEISGWIMCYMILGGKPVQGIALGMGVALVCGFINGLLVAYVHLSPMIVTLGTMSIYHGLIYIISDSRPVSNLPRYLKNFDSFTIINLPTYVWIVILIFVFGQLFLSFTKPGRMLYAIGSNDQAARYSGITVRLYMVVPYVLMGAMCLIAAFVQSAHLLAIDPNAGTNMNLDAIAAVVIGGTSMSGGKGTILGTLIGVLLMGVLRNGLNLLGISSYWQTVAVGAIIIIAISLERLTGGRKG